MKIKKRSVSGLALTISILGITGLWMVTGVQTVKAQLQPPYLSYAAKFVCGGIGSDVDVVKGLYATAVNIHNPQPRGVKFLKKAVIANAERSPRGPISQVVTESLEPDQAMFVDCRDIRSLFGGVLLPAHIEGFVVIMVPPDATGFMAELDVVAKYTARHRNDGSPPTVATDVESIDIEEVQPKRIGQPG
jgi:hypothetical protein